MMHVLTNTQKHKDKHKTHQNRGDVLRLHDKELVISDNGLKELE